MLGVRPALDRSEDAKRLCSEQRTEVESYIWLAKQEG